ncbi:MAG: molybdate ABC transporter substrate-binding protein [Deltaproteobacteria bacterium]|nr:molybdate ABC transporter substrate-binding protein [Deltaproteobacteria bacterium]
MRRLVLLALLAACSSKNSGRTVRIAAASDLARAYEELGTAFQKKTGITPQFQFGSSGLLAKQIEQGAPFFLFAAANKEYADQVVTAGRCDAKSERLYARGRIVVWCPTGTAAPVKLTDLTDPRYKKIAIANPEHAPYGRAAKQALEKAGIWDALQPKLVLGDSVQSTMQYARSGAVDAAVIALSLAVVSDGGSFLKIDDDQYDPLDQSMVVCGNGEEADAAHQFEEFISSPDGREVMTRYGFVLPDAHAKP